MRSASTSWRRRSRPRAADGSTQFGVETGSAPVGPDLREGIPLVPGLCQQPSQPALLSRWFAAAPDLNVFDDTGKDRDHDDRDDHQMEILLDDRQSAEPPAGQQEGEDPGGPARDVIDGEPGIVHLADAGD